MKTPRKHKHASLIRAWLEDDALEIEWLDSFGDWHEVRSPSWDEDTEYRFKPKMITCRNLEFPEPMRVVPGNYDDYWIPQVTSSTTTICLRWANNDYDRRVFKRGFCHTTQAAAEAHARALISLTEIKE